MTTTDFDVIVVGAGQAGPPLAARCATEGLKTAIVERGELGGTCVNNGCTPTKTWVASARAAQVARRAAEWGVVLDAPMRVDMTEVRARKDRLIQSSRTGIADWMAKSGVTVVSGEARFVGPGILAVGVDVLTASRIFLNVGGSPSRPNFPGSDELTVLDNRSILELDRVPEHLVVIGGSYIGLEFAQMFRRFGSEVTICERGPQLLGREDADVSSEIRRILEREGIVCRVSAECLSMSADPAGVRVTTSCAEGEPEVIGTDVLLAVGRTPNTASLDLIEAGIELDARGFIVIDDELRTSAPGVWALGDCTGKSAFTHTAYNDFEIVAANMFDGEHRRVSDRIDTYALFIDPPLARAGMSERQALAWMQETGRQALIGRMPMSRVARAKEAGETQGFMKVIVDAESHLILGAALLGMNADEVIHSILDMMAAQQPYDRIRRTVHIHPTVSELIPTLLADLRPLERT